MAKRSLWNPRTWFQESTPDQSVTYKEKEKVIDDTVVSPGRVSVPNDHKFLTKTVLQGLTNLVTPSYRQDLIPIIRDLYKINPDMSIALQDTFKLANTGHIIKFPNNSDKEASRMREHLETVSKKWSRYTAGIDGLVNRMIAQAMVGGAISIEGVPNKELTGISTVLFVNPEDIRFEREADGVYQPYQINKYRGGNGKPQYIKLNPITYTYVGTYNDTDEPYGIPPFLAALDSIKTQHDMRINFKEIMEIMGMVGFLEAKMEKPARKANESDMAYLARLKKTLKDLKVNLRDGMKDGIVTGYIDDHEFKLNSTSASLQNLDVPWKMNQQSVANGLGVSSSLIGVQQNQTEGGAGIALSKLISQLKNIQSMVKFVLEFLYNLELTLAGMPNKGVVVEFGTSTISDEIKVQQAQEYKIKNIIAKYNQGIISQEQAAWELGYTRADKSEPRIPMDAESAVSTPDRKREADKDKSDRKGRDKEKSNPKRADQDSRPR